MANFRDRFADDDVAILDDVGDEATINGITIQGAFDAPWIGAQLGSTRTDIGDPQFTARDVDVDVVGVQRGQVLNFDGADYDIVDIQPDGTGMTVLVLRLR